MNGQDILHILDVKHVILCGGSESDRRTLINAVSEAIDKTNTAIYRIPPGVRDGDEFISLVRRIFPIIPLPGDPVVEEMSYDQISDLLLDWTEESEKSTFVIWEELATVEPKKTLYGFISDFVTEKYILENYLKSERKLRLLASSSEDLSSYFNSAEIYFGRGEEDPLTDEQVARRSLEIVNLESS
jgi:hypothetical protein